LPIYTLSGASLFAPARFWVACYALCLSRHAGIHPSPKIAELHGEAALALFYPIKLRLLGTPVSTPSSCACRGPRLSLNRICATRVCLDGQSRVGPCSQHLAVKPLH
jgi:hypothetical protein